MVTVAATSEPSLGLRLGFDVAERRRLAVLYGVIAALHGLGWALFRHHVALVQGMTFAGAGMVAYTLGLRHAFDADHIAAIDDTTRLLIRAGRRPLAVGFYFSLGHASIVLALSFAVAFAARGVERHFQALTELGDRFGIWISGTFLIVVGLLNLGLLRDLLQSSAPEASGGSSGGRVIQRLFGATRRWVRSEWQMWVVGLLFGLSFDTATEVGVLGLTASASTQNGLPPSAILALPLLFAAGMCLLDTTDGVVMARAYAWATQDPGRRRSYNLATTALSTAAALGIGGMELLGASLRGDHDGRLAAAVGWVDNHSSTLGMLLLVGFLALWVAGLARARPRTVGLG